MRRSIGVTTAEHVVVGVVECVGAGRCELGGGLGSGRRFVNVVPWLSLLPAHSEPGPFPPVRRTLRLRPRAC